MTYRQTIKMLQSQGKFYINLGLERILAVVNLFGNPQNSLKIIHVAGTNGKGSVCSTIANILTHNGYKTGLYTSPHLVEYTERIKINNEQISKDDFTNYIENVCTIADVNNIDLTEFEILTAAAYKYFYDNKVDFAIMETGLGGRYDATNICKQPVVSVITSISLDHTDRLGDTTDKIAYEKAGIIKENSKVVVNSDNIGLKVIEQIAKEKNAKLIIAKDNMTTTFENEINYVVYNEKKYEFPLLGLYQRQNLSLIFKTIEELPCKISEEGLREGLKTVKWNARLQYIKDKNLIIDGAHNPAAAAELKKSLDYYFKNQKRIFIYSTINTKDYVGIAKVLFNPEDEIYYLNFNYKTAVPFEEYKKKVNFLSNIKQINKENIPSVLEKNGLKILTGSFYMIGEIYENLIYQHPGVPGKHKSFSLP